MAAKSRKKPKKRAARRSKKPSARIVEYLLGKGTPRLLEARVDRHEIHLLVNGPAMLIGSARLLTSLDMSEGATYQAWNRLAAALTCTSFCGRHGVTDIPVAVKTSRIGTFIELGAGPMSMYQSTLVLKPKRKGATLRDVMDEAFGRPRRSYSVMIVPEPASGHLEHDASIFDPETHGGHGGTTDGGGHGGHAHGAGHDAHDHH